MKIYDKKLAINAAMSITAILLSAAIITYKNHSRRIEKERLVRTIEDNKIQPRQLDSSIQRLQKTMAYGDSVIQRTKKAIQGMDEIDRRAEELDREFNKVMRRANNNRPFPQQGAN
jgi:hypothetical protein